ncbi:hypothetical protein VNO78_03254 [Psophocarpus tetragonolobus]|uniref:Uncharacterized protein n=1 Tax=Psophocarpus tetragonolobus TaxID=3891 RepID=A0AAN9XVY5_PSOTE
MHQNAQLHAFKNPRLLQIQHSPPSKFIDLPSPFHLLFLALRHRQPPPPPPSPAAAALRSRLNLTANPRHRADRKPANYELRVIIAMKRSSQRKQHLSARRSKGERTTKATPSVTTH